MTTCTNGKFIIPAILALLAAVSSAQTKTASTVVTTRSLEFLPTDPVFVPGYGTVQTYFTTYDGLPGVSRYDRVSGGILFGGEVRPRSGATGIYEADYATYSLVGVLLDTGTFAFQIPTTDSDANGLPDVVQLDKNGGILIGGSGLSDNGTPFSVAGTISRSAGSSAGSYRVNVVSATGLTNVTYTGSISLVVFTGNVSYQRGMTNSMTVSVHYSLDPSNTVTATTPFTVVNSNRIDIPQFTARSSSGSVVTFRAGSLLRSGNTYRGDFQAIDGNPATSWPDYLNYLWEITDPNDSDTNGIPDLSDNLVTSPTITSQPTSQSASTGTDVSFSVAASGTAPLSYQWRKDGAAIVGATSATLTLGSVQSVDAGSYTVVVTNSAGSVTSSNATLTVVAAAVAPAIAAQPASQSVVAGGSVTFSVSATGTAPLSYQWTKGGSTISGATSAAFTVSPAQTSDAATYAVTVTNSAGSATSSGATLTVVAAAVAPTISTQPASQSVTVGTGVSFTVGASGTAPLSYQWSKDSVALSGATSASYTIAATATTDAGSYIVVVTNSAGSTTSNAATLAVTIPNPGRLINLSILTTFGAGDTMTIGTVLGGAGTSGSKPLLVRAAGPALTQFGVTGALADPKLVFFSGQTVVGTNDNWGGTTALSNAFAQVGAFAFTSAASLDAAVFNPALAAGNYTVQVSGVGGASGAVIAELYDATPAGSFTTTTPRLINVSVLKQINVGEIITAGFVIGGATSKQVLLRAVGPGLVQLGVGGTMADPKLDLFSGQSVINSNDNWGGGSTLVAAFASVGAFGLPTASKDAALLVTLAPGSYTAQVSGVGGTSGIVLVEVYEMP